MVTFNVQQRDLILDLLEDCADERVAAALANESEPLFVKNLENVQGDERDLILFSLAFSPHPETGKLPLNFGPLIQAGGQRRLNVAVTRARAQVTLYSSFDPVHIDLSRSASEGLAHLRSYMEMAERHADAPAVLRPPSARDRHHEDVVDALRTAGLCVRDRVGLSDFTVDIGVAAKPDGPWVAIFLDGPDYAKRATVGDRESLPYEVLVGFMGWSRVERVWLPDWVRDREEVIDRIRNAASAPAPTIPAPAPGPAQPSSGSSPRSPTHASPRAPLESEQSRTSRTSTTGSGRYVGRAGTWRQEESRDNTANAGLIASAGTRPTRADAVPTPGRSQPSAGTVFVPAHEHLAGTRDVLDEMEGNPTHWQLFGVQLTDVIVKEAPIAATRLARIVGRRFGLQRVAASRSDAILRRVRSDLIEQTPFGVFVWAPGQDRENYADFRTARGVAVRSIEEIAPRELLNAMAYLARTGLGISREELVRETAGLFGFARMASKITAHLDAVIDYGVTLSVLFDDGQSISTQAADRHQTRPVAQSMPRRDVNSSLEQLVREIVAGAVSWHPGSFAILASASQPDWYVQFAGDPHSQYAVEVSDPAFANARAFDPEQLKTVIDLGFRSSEVNFQKFVSLDTDDDVDELCATLLTVLTQVFGLSTSGEVTVKLEVADASS